MANCTSMWGQYPALQNQQQHYNDMLSLGISPAMINEMDYYKKREIEYQAYKRGNAVQSGYGAGGGGGNNQQVVATITANCKPTEKSKPNRKLLLTRKYKCH